ncbi:MAG: T9SS type A sorting domain-containing protein, partial [Bacteroidota bacterium]
NNTAQPGGGVFSGTGVNAGVFSPSVAGAGNFVIQYVYTDANACSNSATAAVSVASLAAPSLSIAKNFYCNNSGNVFLTVSPSNGTFTGVGVSQAGLFNPVQAGIGSHVIGYSITSGPCTNYSSISVTVSACLGMNENSSNSINLWPNPSSANFFIESNSSASLQLFNQLGALVLTQNLEIGKNKVETTRLAYGLYHAIIIQNNCIIQKELIINKD